MASPPYLRSGLDDWKGQAPISSPSPPPKLRWAGNPLVLSERGQFSQASLSVRQEEKSTKINTFLGPETTRWGGGLPHKGVVAEKFVPSLESLSSLGFEERNLGCFGNFAGMSQTFGGVQKVCAKKSSCACYMNERQLCDLNRGTSKVYED